jgi:CMP-N-acetylneuraminic acid synthetase
MKIKNLCLICAKGKSSGLKNKNLRKIKNKTLFEITSEHILKSKLIDKVIVSTDSKNITRIAKKYGFDVPFVRPKYLCQKLSPEWEVWKHALKYFYKANGYYPKKLIVCPCTSPNRDSGIIDKAIKKFNLLKSDVLISICKTNLSPSFNMVKINKKNRLEIYQKSKKNIFNRQEANQAYQVSTNIYVINPKHVLNNKNIFQSNKIDYIEIDRYSSLDIDDKYDLLLAKLSIKKNV